MRIRQIVPAWWLDKQLYHGLTAEERWVYVGLWMIADDAGWLRWDVERIGAELFPYATPRHRERLVASAAEKLQSLDGDSPHLVIHPCGHAQVPKVTRYQHTGGKPVYSVSKQHATESPVTLRNPHNGKELGTSNGTSNGTELGSDSDSRKSRSARAQVPATVETMDAWRRQGLPVDA